MELSQMRSGSIYNHVVKPACVNPFVTTKTLVAAEASLFPHTTNGNSTGIFFCMSYAVHYGQYMLVISDVIVKSKLQELCTC